MVGVRVSLKLEASWDFFPRRIEWCPKQIVLIWLRLHDRWGDPPRRVAQSARPGNPPSRGRIRGTWNSRKIHFGGGVASVKGNKWKPQHRRLQQEQQVSAEENQSPKHLVCQHFSRLRA